MATITNTYFTSLLPIELKYLYTRDEPLQITYTGYNQGIDFYKIDGLDNFQDITINRDSCFILTSSVCLSCFFQTSKSLKLGEISGTLKLQSRSLSSEFITYSSVKNAFISLPVLSSDAISFFINLKENSTAVEILVKNKFVQVDSNYPYTLRLDDEISDPAQKNRQEFFCEIYNENLAFKTLTDSGYRYLAVGNDGIIRATGVILNEQLVNDYFFKSVQNVSNVLTYNFIPDNNWVTYYLDFPSQIYNKDVTLNKVFSNIKTNFLIDFPIEPTLKNNTAIFNMANLKTSLTPTGSPPEIDNSYNEIIITKN